MSISIKGLDHVVIRTDHLQEMIRFYETVLNCPLERSAEHVGLYQMRAGSALIDLVDVKGEIGQRGGAAPGATARNMDHYCVRVEPFDEAAIRRHLKSHGVTAGETAQRTGAEGTGSSIYIQDPDGNTVELKGPATG